MARSNFSDLHCSVARTLEVVGERWSMLIIRDALYGVRRFEDFQRDLGVARNVLTDRLQQLTQHGVLERVQYEERPPRFEYRLTDKGHDLLPVVLAMVRWGDRWGGAAEPPLRLTHVTCGNEVHADVVCDHCGDELRLRELRAHPIPIKGARYMAGASASA